MGDNQLAGKVVENFLMEMPARVQKLLKAVSDRDAIEVRACAHQIKGASSAVGGTALSRIAREVELAGRTMDWQELDGLKFRLEAQFIALKQALAAQTWAESEENNQQKHTDENVNCGR